MDTSLIFLCLSFLISKGVFGEEVKMMLVMKGESVTLYTDVIKHKDDKIMWYYGPENTFVARINGEASSRMLSDDERYRDKLKINNQTGDLTISDMRTEHSGLYTLKISRNNKVSYKKFDVTVSGEVKSVPVREGHSVILYTHVLKQRDDVMDWRFGPENTFVAKINETTFTSSDDERFRDRVKRDDSTGALMINDTRTHHSGLYTLRINSNNKVSYKMFDVTIHDEVKSVPVREGHSVILYTHVLKQRDDVMEWRYGPENTFVAVIDGEAGTIRLSDDKRFRDGVKLDYQTGSLMIGDTRSHHSGLYQLKINSNNKVSYKKFDLTIHDSLVLWVLVVPVVLLICVCVFAFVCTQKEVIKRFQEVLCKTSQVLKDSKSSIDSRTMLDAEAPRTKQC